MKYSESYISKVSNSSTLTNLEVIKSLAFLSDFPLKSAAKLKMDPTCSLTFNVKSYNNHRYVGQDGNIHDPLTSPNSQCYLSAH